ncbi:response regulator transcription factor [Paenibacillus apiarius]|uniref:Response regulator transcription factor n=1 Tax=Paenibacillus apiarius TaxID=46240 RepID=A0ABT4DR47_9BACL|nr:response regulator transcription factor [Paenibacillus apiarius]MBN3526331.1 response regulator transcription factor [Paenibacillus apiarius]MCY9516035.1 response regulator transcription factor [Paenibacillus apiarius]MCY9518506.1 response regulator transcription factor [Paenibacillus apiarius]MCY9551093.1 response regulator transcription factor [Paenibacillus apiarius]MCY9558247.1 response regulator transcription factor [Paenibacillus apiarius]
MKGTRILVVDDERNMRNLIRIYLKKHGYDVIETDNGIQALEIMEKEAADLVILDIMMPGMDGWSVCERIRERWPIPILMLTARTDTKDKVQGLNMGADDYVVKPFDGEELVARVGALLRRAQASLAGASAAPAIHVPGMDIYPDSREIRINGQAVDFTPKEFELLLLLAANAQRVYSRDRIVEQLWDYDYEGDIRSVDNHVKNIRDKVHRAQLSYDPIQTVWGVGYKFNQKGTS